MPVPFIESPLTRWFDARFVQPTPVQAAAWPLLVAPRHALIVSPTGTGKTLAAFFAVLHQLALEQERGELVRTIHAVYVSPLRALGYDLEKNLNTPLREVFGDAPPIRVGLRSGDTSPAERRRQFDQPPHILLTTPESLCLLLSQAKWLPHLARVRWVIVDEVHALAENKRGSHLSLSLERLSALVESGLAPPAPRESPDASRVVAGPPQRIGLSATVAPLADVARFLVGTERECEVVDVSAAKRVDLSVFTPLTRDPYPAAGFSGARLMRELARQVQRHRTTLVFTNTRSGAESATFWLKTELPALADQIECHHASLDRDVRQEVEDRLKRGELRAVVCSTSLELGIDIGSVDLVVMLASPKGVTKALQRTGRAGHDLRRVSRGRLMATNVQDLVECCATARLARTRHLEAVRIVLAPLDVLAQHLMGMGCTARWTREAALRLVRRATPYRDLAAADFDAVLDYLAGGGKSLRQAYRETFGKIELDDQGFEARPGLARRDFLQNVGVIPNEGVTRVQLRARTLGTVEESFARRLQPGDVFVLGGEPVRVERHGVLELFVSRARGARPTVPRWNANKMPLSNRVAAEIAAFRAELRARFEADERDDTLGDWIGTRLECDGSNARVILATHRAQHRLSELPTAEFLLVEEFEEHESSLAEPATASWPERPNARRGLRSERNPVPPPWPARRHYVFHSLIGRAANDTLSRVVARRLSRLRGGNAIATPDDYGFLLTVATDQRIEETDLPGLLALEGFAADLEASLARSELLKYHFRNAAQTGLMVYRNYFGDQKPVRKLQFSSDVIFAVLTQHEPDHVLLREAQRDTVESFLDLAAAVNFLRELKAKPIRLRRPAQLPPLAFAMYAASIKEALWVEEPAETLERLYHEWWQRLEPTHGPA